MGVGKAQARGCRNGLREARAWVATAPPFFLTGISSITALSFPVRPGSPGRPFLCVLTGTERHPRQEAGEAR